MRALRCALIACAAACSPAVRPVAPVSAPPPLHIVATERGPSGGRLVVIDEAGLRTAELVPAAVETARDNSAVFSPDGAWIAFASTRGRGESMEHTSLWIVAAQLDAQPVRVTDDHGDDLAPAWSPDGRALIFSSDRGGSIDLWRIAVARNGERMHAAGKPEQLTHDAGAELGPSVAADGRIAFAQVARDAGGTKTSRIAVRAPDGQVALITNGPGDVTPAWSPDGKTLAFAAPMARAPETIDGHQVQPIDADILAVDADGGHRRVLVEQAGTDESGPVWSHDGRWLFATSLARRAEDGKPLLSSIIYVDLAAAAPRPVRMLAEPSAPVSRLAPALAPGGLDDRALAAGPDYHDTLRAILVHAMLKEQTP